MRISKYVFPLLLLVIFFGVIALGAAAGLLESGSGGGRHQRVAPAPAAEAGHQIGEEMALTWPW
jgi:hypothetical protein